MVGSFNGRDPTAHRMRRTEDDAWAITVYLAADRAVYLFSVDGVMWVDPADDERLPNGGGSEYSVRRVGAEPASAGAAVGAG